MTFRNTPTIQWMTYPAELVRKSEVRRSQGYKPAYGSHRWKYKSSGREKGFEARFEKLSCGKFLPSAEMKLWAED